MPEGEIAVFRCALAESLAGLHALPALLTASERERLGRFQSEPAAIAFLQTRVLTRRVLATTLGCDVEDVILTPNAFGKPEISAPANLGLAFNATHTRGWGGVAIANIPDCEIGLDFEVHNPARDIAALAARHYSTEEQRLLDAQPDDAARLRTFFDIWTAKEACIKSTGKGLATDLRSFTALSYPRGEEVMVTFADTAREAALGVRTLPMVPGYSAALSIRYSDSQLTFSKISLYEALNLATGV